MADPMWAQDGGASEGDPVVIVVSRDGVQHPCYAKAAKTRQFTIHGAPCDHVGEATDGTWIYEMRSY